MEEIDKLLDENLEYIKDGVTEDKITIEKNQYMLALSKGWNVLSESENQKKLKIRWII